jgi:hypothetical protein
VATLQPYWEQELFAQLVRVVDCQQALLDKLNFW